MAQLKIQVTPINWHGIKQDAINLSLFFFVTKRILFRESFYLSPLMVKLKIRVTPNDHRFALLCHCRAVGTMNREGWGVIALIYFDRRDVVRFSNPGVLAEMWWAQSAPSGWNRVNRTPKFRGC